jgi:hypothetical protein
LVKAGKQTRRKTPHKPRKPAKPISASQAQKSLKELYEAQKRPLPKYVNCLTTFCRSLDPLAVDAIGVTAGARPWDFLASMVEVWRKMPASVQDALDEQEHKLVD